MRLFGLYFSGSVSCKSFVPRRKLAVVAIKVIAESTRGKRALRCELGHELVIVELTSRKLAEANTMISIMILPMNHAMSCPSVFIKISENRMLRGQKLDISKVLVFSIFCKKCYIQKYTSSDTYKTISKVKNRKALNCYHICYGTKKYSFPSISEGSWKYCSESYIKERIFFWTPLFDIIYNYHKNQNQGHDFEEISGERKRKSNPWVSYILDTKQSRYDWYRFWRKIYLYPYLCKSIKYYSNDN